MSSIKSILGYAYSQPIFAPLALREALRGVEAAPQQRRSES